MIIVKVVKSEKVSGAFADSVKKFSKLPGVCLLLTKPYSAVKEALKKKGVNAEKIFFVDAVAESEEDNVVHVQPGNLTALSITISQTLQSLPSGKKFFIIDALSALTIQNSVQAVQKFSLFLLERLRKWDAETVIIVAKESTDAALLAILKQGADKTEEK